MQKSFWQNFESPIIGLAPMDGVTDAAMRFITKKYGNPTLTITEFTSAEGIRAGALRLMKDFRYSEIETPIVAQVFGADPTAFYPAAIVVAAMGFDGIDINMGCPAKSIEEHGAGAALIQDPKRAGEIIKVVKKALTDWSNGLTLKQANLHPHMLEFLEKRKLPTSRKLLPISVKTRIGFDKPVTKDWISHLLSFDLANISLHGRTLKQLYQGQADWEQIGIAAALVKQTPTTFLGNGDIASLHDAHQKIKQYGLNGVLIGRAAFGNPWVFKGIEAPPVTKLAVALEHARKYEELFPTYHFLPMRKHLAWYAKGFESAAELRQQLVMTNSASEAETIITPLL